MENSCSWSKGRIIGQYLLVNTVCLGGLFQWLVCLRTFASFVSRFPHPFLRHVSHPMSQTELITAPKSHHMRSTHAVCKCVYVYRQIFVPLRTFHLSTILAPILERCWGCHIRSFPTEFITPATRQHTL